MNIKDNLLKIKTITTAVLRFVGKLIWSCIMDIATVITFLLIFVLLLAILPASLVWILSIGSLLWLVYTYRHNVATIIAILITCGLVLALVSSLKYSLFPDWVLTKSSSVFRMHYLNKSFGVRTFKDETFDTLTCYGASHLDNVSIKGPLTIYGRLDANDLNVQGKVFIYGQTEMNDVQLKDDLMVYGKLTLDKGVVAGKTKIYGSVRIEDGKLNDLFVHARRITLTSSSVKNIYMEKESGKITVVLVKTKVEGDIVFDSGKGRVIVDRNSSISGKVIDGDIEVR
jgi:cytoskeletal protein CcmA (bactofilin family)